MKFNQKEYIKDYKKKNKKLVAFELNKEEAEELNNLCNKKNVKKVDVLRKGIEWLKNK